MNYAFHYQRLMDRAPKKRPKGVYLERHRIVPGCMGGKYVTDNIAFLTPEEHYIAHQLLVKMYPNNLRLISAASIMSTNSTSQSRSNKLYGWLRRKLSQSMTGNKRGLNNKNSKGKHWTVKNRTSPLRGPMKEETKLKISTSKVGKHNIGVSKYRRNSMWITDGTIDKVVPKSEIIPYGYHRGRVLHGKT